MRRRISIFGATGSVGENTVDLVLRQGGAETYDVQVLTGNSNVETLARQARELKARHVVVGSAELEPKLAALLSGTSTEISSGPEALLEAARVPVDWAMSAIVGAAGLPPTVELARQGTVLALANKESLVCAGGFLKRIVREAGTRMIPVDSEHSAIFQAIAGAPVDQIERIILTASGGPFRTWSADDIAGATLEDALIHPNWNMGRRITIDSASMFNKALEVIEAQYLFDVSPEKIEVVVHPQSIVHSMVGFTDGAVMAQMGPPDMRGPIGYALNYPERPDLPVERLDFTQLSRLDFEVPCRERFPALGLAYRAMEIGGGAGAVLNAAKEAALDAFLANRIGFTDMAALVGDAVEAFADEAAKVLPDAGLDPILKLDRRARDHVVAQIARQKALKDKLAG